MAGAAGSWIGSTVRSSVPAAAASSDALSPAQAIAIAATENVAKTFRARRCTEVLWRGRAGQPADARF
jgi:hypothetical protein